MHKPHKSLCKGGEQPLSKAVFFNIAGISPELEEFVSDFFQLAQQKKKAKLSV
jgi:hypothetical protein